MAHSDHALLFSKIDLWIEDFEVSKEQEEQKDSKRIMNIYMSKSTLVMFTFLPMIFFIGSDFCLYAQLYDKLQKTVSDPANGFMDRVTAIQHQLQELENNVWKTI